MLALYANHGVVIVYSGATCLDDLNGIVPSIQLSIYLYSML